MSNEIVNLPQGTNVPAHLQNADMSGSQSLIVSEGGFPSISIAGKTFTLKNGNNEFAFALGQPLDIVILAADPVGAKAKAKAWYATAWDGSESNPPDCMSSNGIIPDPGCAMQQAPVCATCPQNAWNTGRDQLGNATRGKACSDLKFLFVVGANNVNGDIYKLRVPPTSLSNLTAWGKALDDKRIPMEAVITRIVFLPADKGILLGFDACPDVNTYPGAPFLTAEQYATTKERVASDEIQKMLHHPDTVQVAVPEVTMPGAVQPATPGVTQPVTTPVNQPVMDPFAQNAAPQSTPEAQTPVAQGVASPAPAVSPPAPAQEAVAPIAVTPAPAVPVCPPFTMRVPHTYDEANGYVVKCNVCQQEYWTIHGHTCSDGVASIPIQPEAVVQQIEEVQAMAPAQTPAPDNLGVNGLVDKQGVPFNPELHFTEENGQPRMNKDGSWRKRRNVTQPVQAPVVQPVVQAAVQMPPAAPAPVQPVAAPVAPVPQVLPPAPPVQAPVPTAVPAPPVAAVPAPPVAAPPVAAVPAPAGVPVAATPADDALSAIMSDFNSPG
ncbi:MAG: hypothetical protein KAS32_02160 [Candidatus Peribacteraceae bacterium]|nr:hypothetical protein [Candidatus Peribacteraceae bacterium]